MSDSGSYFINLEQHLIQDGPKFRSHSLVVDQEQAWLKPTLSSMMFCVIYIVVGFFLVTLAGYIYYRSQQLDLAIFVGGFGVAIATFGLTLIQPFLIRATFDKQKSVFNNSSDRKVKLDNILSLQINNKIVKRKQGLNYPCYELNMLTKNGRRINIMNHNDLPQLQRDAQLLGHFLNVDVQDLQREITF
ncbi:MAG: hypothetical protein ACPG4U_02145 [Pseudomonadales bacterium]